MSITKGNVQASQKRSETAEPRNMQRLVGEFKGTVGNKSNGGYPTVRGFVLSCWFSDSH